ncbi:DUF2442 domain-containing protein [Pseudomonas sp. 6D_7.1_Bac1]|jgi:hypothetical protein|uniref:DUF2442 domain-containing protein n=1 Tax=Pseudomonas sp. 6D_7.1_Bac1 TaxID=2971615 RepID=UPI0021C9F600|nr:DUF2442 domain-containing protein [Pseudomonas sp. 6D_7.1_Bac1]MCU1750943.1 DUF2442 domain-containing protein [Pseudomonas sp. 6D_7.1_Bac1]
MKTVQVKEQLDRPLTEAALDDAIERGRARRSGLNAISVSVQQHCLLIDFEDGSAVLLPVKNYPEFDGFEAADFNQLKVGFAGTALCHDGKDLQVSIAGMIQASKPLMDMAASVIASRNGRQSSVAKALAARANGKKGGRPRKVDIAL